MSVRIADIAMKYFAIAFEASVIAAAAVVLSVIDSTLGTFAAAVVFGYVLSAGLRSIREWWDL